jgi:hypothetical protein
MLLVQIARKRRQTAVCVRHDNSTSNNTPRAAHNKTTANEQLHLGQTTTIAIRNTCVRRQLLLLGCRSRQTRRAYQASHGKITSKNTQDAEMRHSGHSPKKPKEAKDAIEQNEDELDSDFGLEKVHRARTNQTIL